MDIFMGNLIGFILFTAFAISILSFIAQAIFGVIAIILKPIIAANEILDRQVEKL